jgi:predicted dehydrogenase
MVGGGTISRAHIMGYLSLPLLHELQDVRPIFSVIAEANLELASNAARKLGFSNFSEDYRQVTRSDKVDLVDIVAPTYLHAEVAIDAAKYHKAILCEKPMALNSLDAKNMYEVAERESVVNAVGFSCRKIPAVILAKNMIEDGSLGKITQFRANFLEDWAAERDMPLTWRYKASRAGGGAVADLGSHIIDLARFLVGDIKAVCAMQQTFIDRRRLPDDLSKEENVDVDDYTAALIRFKNGVPGGIEASWASLGRKAFLEFEVNGTEGSVCYNFENPNALQFYSKQDAKDRQGYRTITMGPVHPYGKAFFFPVTGGGAGFQDSLNNEICEVVDAVCNGKPCSPSFYDGWKVNQIIEAIQRSAASNRWVELY